MNNFYNTTQVNINVRTCVAICMYVLIILAQTVHIYKHTYVRMNNTHMYIRTYVYMYVAAYIRIHNTYTMSCVSMYI